MVSVTEVFDLESAFSCPQCCSILNVESNHYEHAFDGHQLQCHRCEGTFDLYATMRHQVENLGVMGSPIVFAGARQKILRVPLIAGQTSYVDLTAFGVPDTAEVLRLNLTAEATSCAPILVTGNDALVSRLGPRFLIYARPNELDAPTTHGKVNVSAIWFDAREDDTAITHLVDAAKHFSLRRYQSMIVPANVAVESLLSGALLECVAAFTSREHAGNFLRDAATYSHQLNVLAPIASFMVNAPRLPDNVRGDLNTLRGLRNKLAHSGTCDSLDEKRAAQLLTSAIFGMRYASMLRTRIGEARQNGTLPPKV